MVELTGLATFPFFPPSLLTLLASLCHRVGEAQLVGRAYAYAVDWGAALYYQFVNGGDETYLAEYLATFTLTPEVMLNVVKK